MKPALLKLASASALIFLSAPAVSQPAPPPALDPAIAARIKAAPSQGSVYSVLSNTQFTGQVLKADTITFSTNSLLELTESSFPWIAIVARSFRVAGPDERFTIITSTSSINPAVQLPIPKSGAAGQGNSGSSASDGGPGANGSSGSTGRSGSRGVSSPVIYILTDDIITQPGAPKPKYIDMLVKARGSDGGDGGRGQPGQDGGQGGSGGPSEWNGIYCNAGAGSGGRGGNGGLGGNGGRGGDGGNGSNVYLGGPAPVLNILSFGGFNTLPGKSGVGGAASPGGNGGPGGPRGSHNGGCGGGGDGPGGPGAGYGSSGSSGANGAKGIIKTVSITLADLF